MSDEDEDEEDEDIEDFSDDEDDDSQDDIDSLLSQSDIDALMDEANSSDDAVVYNYAGERIPSSQEVQVETYDFRNPVFLTENEMRQMRIFNESFVGYLNARLSMYLRMDVNLKMSGLNTMTYAKFTENIANPAYISMFKVEPLNGVGIFDINARLALTIVNRMLGGKGMAIDEDRSLTEIEMALMDDVVIIVMSEWCKQWEDIKTLTVSLLGRENNGRFLQTSPHEAIILVLEIEATIAEFTEKFEIGIPYYMVEPIVKEMQERTHRFDFTKSDDHSSKWTEAYDSVNVPISAEWRAFDLTVRDLLGLREGDVLELPSDIASKTRLRVKNSSRFLGEIGLDNDHVAIKITEQTSYEL